MAKKVQIAKGESLPKKKVSKLREKPGGSNIGEYKNVKKGDFAGSIPGTFPINNLSHARAALSYAHNDKNPAAVKRKVYAKYPQLKKRHDERKK